MMAPMIHLNGTAHREIMDDLCNAYEALDRAKEALRKTAPNARDYYVISPHAYKQAVEEHQQRLRYVSQAYDQIGELLEKVSEQESNHA